MKHKAKRKRAQKAPLPALYLHLRPNSTVIVQSDRPFRGALLANAEFKERLKRGLLTFTGQEETTHQFVSDSGQTNHYYLVLDRGEVTAGYKVIRNGKVGEEGFVGGDTPHRIL